MASISTIEIKNDMTKEVLEAMKSQVLLGMKACGMEAEGYAKADCPVDTGLLRNSITWALGGEVPAVTSYSSNDGTEKGSYSGQLPKPADGEYTLYVGTNVEYAVHVEYRDASHKTGKAHFLRDSLTQHADTYRAILEAALK